MNRPQEIQKAYQALGKSGSFNDGMITCTTWPGNGFHAFPDKEAAYRETCRVLRKGGIFCGGFYVTGVRAGTDRWIRNAYERGGFLTPPFESLSSLTERLGVMYSHADVSSVKSIACFCCVK